VAVLAERQYDTGLTFLDNEKPADQPEKHNDCACHAGTNTRVARVIIAIIRRSATCATATLTSKQAVNPLIEFSPQLIKIRRAVARSTGLARLFPFIILRTTTPTRVIEGKDKAEFFSY
jgi:hypothetical protein